MSEDVVAGGYSFDLFGTLVTTDRPNDPAEAVAAELANRGVTVPTDWSAAYRESHLSRPDGAEIALSEHVAAALASRGVSVDDDWRTEINDAVSAAFEPTVRTRNGAVEAVEAAATLAPVGLLSNCSVPGLVSRVITASDLDPSMFDAVVTSVGCGWRKPDPRAFASVAMELGTDPSDLVHIGDDPRTDGGSTAVGGDCILTETVSLDELPSVLADRQWD